MWRYAERFQWFSRQAPVVAQIRTSTPHDDCVNRLIEAEKRREEKGFGKMDDLLCPVCRDKQDTRPLLQQQK